MTMPSPGTWFRLQSRRMQDDVDHVVRTLAWKGDAAVGGLPLADAKDDHRAHWSMVPVAGTNAFRLINRAAGATQPLELTSAGASLASRGDRDGQKWQVVPQAWGINLVAGGAAFYANGGRTYAGATGMDVDNLWFFESAERVVSYYVNMYVQTPWSTWQQPLWEHLSETKETATYRQYDVAVCRAGTLTGLNQSMVCAYKFPNGIAAMANAAADWPSVRRNYLVAEFEIPSTGDPANVKAVSFVQSAALAAFKQLFDAILADVRKTRSDFQFGIKYTGHGDTDGLFERALDDPQDDAFLAYVRSQLGRNIDLLDWCTNCSTSTWANHRMQAQVADFIVGSDLDRGRGFTSLTCQPFFYTAGTTIREAAQRAVQMEGESWQTNTNKSDMTEKQDPESVYAYDCSWLTSIDTISGLSAFVNQTQFGTGADVASLTYRNPEAGGFRRVDVRSWLQSAAGNGDVVQLFDLYRFAGTDDRAFFDWASKGCDIAQGLYFNIWTA